MGLIQKLESKRQELVHDQSAIGTFIALLLTIVVLGGVTIGGLAIYNLTVRPDVVYNITDTGFSLAGMEVDSLWLIVAIGGGLLILWLMFRKK